MSNKQNNFCPQCGKRTPPNSIHTCSPQYAVEWADKVEQGYRRYEAVRKMSIQQFKEIVWRVDIGCVDDSVDEFIAKGYK